MHAKLVSCLIGLFFVFLNTQAQSGTIVSGLTFSAGSCSVSAECTNYQTGTHYHHSSSVGTPGLAEVGSWNFSNTNERVRGLSEFNLGGLGAAVSVFVTFDTLSYGQGPGLLNNFPFDGTINIDAYLGNNAEDFSDYEALSTGSIGSFSTAGLAFGTVFSFDIKIIFNTAIGVDPSLGVRLSTVDAPENTAWTFNNFRLTTTNESTSVPEPGALILLVIGLAGLGITRNLKNKALIKI